MGELDHEQVILGVVSKKRELVEFHIVGSGDYVGSRINSNAINKYLVKSAPNSMIFLVHNHPQDDAVPSEEDIETTDYIKDVCRILGRSFVDHVIIAKDEYYSFNTGVRTKYVRGDH